MGVTINNKSSTTEPPPQNRRQPKPPRGLHAFYWHQIFTLNSAVVEVQEIFSSHGSFLTIAILKTNTEASFSDLHLSISNDIVSTKNFHKRDDFDFEIVNFPF